jgi:hypothetical protein
MERRNEVNRTRRIGGNRPGAEAEAEPGEEEEREGERERCLVESEGARVGDGEGRAEEAGGMRGVRSDGATEDGLRRGDMVSG